MKLILKRVERPGDIHGPFALHTEDGTILPSQLSTNMASDGQGPVRLIVVFTVDGLNLVVEGDPA